MYIINGSLPYKQLYVHECFKCVSHTDSLRGSRLVAFMRTQTSGGRAGVNKPMISLLIDVNATVGYKAKNN